MAIVIKNKAEHVKTFSYNPDPKAKDPADGTLKIVLKPLINILSDEDAETWAKLSDATIPKGSKKALGHPGVLKLIKAGVLLDLTKFAKVAGELPKSLASIEDDRMAMEFAGGIMELDVLRRWKKTEKREEVLSVLNEQLDAVEALEAATA